MVDLDRDRVAALATLATDVRYWRALNPSLTVEGTPPTRGAESRMLDEHALRSIAEQVREEGWFHADAFLAADSVTRLRAGVERLAEAGWLPAFSFVYDEFWTLTRTTPADALLTSILGRGYRQRAYLWTHRVDVRRGAHGWTPHADGSHQRALLGDGRPAMLSLWIPLSDATLDNGCMYVIPTSSHPTIGRRFGELESVGREELGDLLQSARALPAKAGSLMGWHGGVVHWGSKATGHWPHPRISVALEYQSAGAGDDTLAPLLKEGAPLPPLWQRLLLIALQINLYLRRFEPETHDPNMLALAKLLHLWCERRASGAAVG